jgi:hypothetical protein
VIQASITQRPRECEHGIKRYRILCPEEFFPGFQQKSRLFNLLARFASHCPPTIPAGLNSGFW